MVLEQLLRDPRNGFGLAGQRPLERLRRLIRGSVKGKGERGKGGGRCGGPLQVLEALVSHRFIATVAYQSLSPLGPCLRVYSWPLEQGKLETRTMLLDD